MNRTKPQDHAFHTKLPFSGVIASPASHTQVHYWRNYMFLLRLTSWDSFIRQ